jgi:hypothetical protein
VYGWDGERMTRLSVFGPYSASHSVAGRASNSASARSKRSR